MRCKWGKNKEADWKSTVWIFTKWKPLTTFNLVRVRLHNVFYHVRVPDFITQRFMGMGWFPAVLVETKKIYFWQNSGHLQPEETLSDDIYSCLWLAKNSQNKMLKLNRGVSVIWCVTADLTTLWQTIWWSAVDTCGKVASHSELIRVTCCKRELASKWDLKAKIPAFLHHSSLNHWGWQSSGLMTCIKHIYGIRGCL